MNRWRIVIGAALLIGILALFAETRNSEPPAVSMPQSASDDAFSDRLKKLREDMARMHQETVQREKEIEKESLNAQ